MGLFEKIFGSQKKEAMAAQSYFKTLSAYTPVFHNWGGSIYESELVRSAINAKAEHISKMAVKIQGSAQSSLQTKLRAAPNEFQTWSQFLYRLSTILDVNNTAFIVPVLDRGGYVSGIETVLPERWEIVDVNGDPFLRLYFKDSKTATLEMSRCGIMRRFQYKHDFAGESNGALKQTMALIDIQNQGISEGVKSAATYRFMAQLSNFAKPEDLAKERKRFSAENLSSNADGGGILLFPNTYNNIQQIKTSPWTADAEQMKLINTNVYNYFGVNEKIIQNSATAEELDAFYNGALEPFAIQLSEVLTKMLFTLNERAHGSSVVVTSDRLQYMSVQNKISLITTLGDRGMITVNEARHLLNYPAVENGDDMMPIRGEYYNNVESEVTSNGEA